MASAVSGMLSNTEETKPSPNAVCQEGVGSSSTGIIEAHSTRLKRNTAPLNASGSTSQSCRRTRMVSRIATHSATPMKGKWSANAGKLILTVTLVAMAATSISPTTPMRAQSTATCWCAWRRIGE